MSKARSELTEAEQGGEFLFHGSPKELDQLEPRQAFRYDEKLGKMVEDGEQSVCATHLADIAIFRALVNHDNAPTEHDSEFGSPVEDNSFCHLGASHGTLDQVRGKVGYVHLLDRKDFSRHSPMEWRSSNIVVPVKSIKVTYEDLPDTIKIL